MINEEAFTDRLAQRDVEIVYPELLSMDQQIALWRSRTLISGFLGSALLTAAFSSNRTVIALNHEAQVYSNQVLVDKAADNRSAYLYLHGSIHDLGGSLDFSFNFVFDDPIRTADEFLRHIDHSLAAPPTRRRSLAAPETVATRAYVDQPFGRNLSRHRPASQSSFSDDFSRPPDVAADAGGAVNGRLSGRYQFHTGFEAEAWWQVDLLEVCTIHEVRLFNRLDAGADRADRLRILGSLDGIAWSELHRLQEPTTFGGVDGRPYRWIVDRPVSVRFIRLDAPHESCLHLDQVEVFGDSSDSQWANHQPTAALALS